MEELTEIMRQVGGSAHQQVADKVSELRKKPVYKDDPSLQSLILKLAEAGYLTT